MLKKISLFLFIAGTSSFLILNSQEMSLEDAQEFLAIKNKDDARAFKQKHGDTTEVTDSEMEYLELIKKALLEQQAGNLEKATELFNKANSGTK